MSEPTRKDLDGQATAQAEEVSSASAESVKEAYPTIVPQRVKTQTAPLFGTLGEYDLVQEIARGGMGVVYKAWQRSLQRTVALKTILAGPQATPEDIERFCIEARAAANLDHPNIVQVYDIGEEDGQHYFTMAFVEGDSLAGLVKKKKIVLSFREIAGIVAALAEALEYAHEKNIIHRDLKPENVLLDHFGRPRITDFGLARRLEVDSRLTATGQVLGTPSYMAPEQAMGEASCGPGIDIHALGGILYFLLTGQPPFEGSTLMLTLCKVVKESPVPPRQLNPAVPAELEAICLKCLEKQPAKRFASAGQLAQALQAWAGKAPPEPTATQPLSARLKAAASRGDGLAPTQAIDVPATTALARPRTLWPCVAGGAVLASLAVAVVLWGQAHSWWARAGSPEQQASPNIPQAAQDPGTAHVLEVLNVGKLEELPHEFGVKIAMAGSSSGPSGQLFLPAGTTTLTIEVDRDAYVEIWSYDRQGTGTQIYPNTYESAQLLRAGKVYTLPGNDQYVLPAEVSTGLEHLVVVASTKPWPPFAGRRDGPFVVCHSKDDQDRLQRHLRGITVRSSADQATTAAVCEQVIPYRVLPGKN
jgi:predicted Ser/Thr protein kinase